MNNLEKAKEYKKELEQARNCGCENICLERIPHYEQATKELLKEIEKGCGKWIKNSDNNFLSSEIKCGYQYRKNTKLNLCKKDMEAKKICEDILK